EGAGAGPGREADGTVGSTSNGVEGKPPQRVRKLFVDGQYLLIRLTGDGSAWISNLSRDAYVVGCEPDPTRDGIVLLIQSETFPTIAEGETIPELTPQTQRSSR